MTELAELHDELRSVARDLLGKADGEVPWERLAEAGWLGLEVPDGLDGSGATFAEAAVVLEEMGRAATAGPYLGTAVLGVGALRSLGAGSHRDAMLAEVAAGQTRLAVALAPGGDDVGADPPFEIRGAGSGARLFGRAEFVVDATAADRFLLLARDEHGEVAFVDVTRRDLEVVPQPVLDATRRFGTIVADGAPIHDAIRPIDGDAATAAQHLADRAAVAIACDSFGLAEAMLDATVTYAGVRRQFDRPIGSFQAVKHACADMLVSLTVGRELLGAAVDAVAANAPDAGAAVARATSFVTEASVDVVGSALQLHGGIGYTWESGIHVYLKRAVLNRSWYGSPAAQRRRLVAAVLPALRSDQSLTSVDRVDHRGADDGP